jgi:alkaline phosphatase
MPPAVTGEPNVILFIGDGMGFEQVRAGSLYASGKEGTLFFERLPHRGEVTTAAADSKVTDSAAGATAMATGVKVANGVISRALPGNGAYLETIVERSRLEGRAIGLVTTAHLTHATPAAFGAHARNRGDFKDIAAWYLYGTRPEVLLGGGGHGLHPTAAARVGYTVVGDRQALLALDPATTERVCGLFGDGHMPYERDGVAPYPHLSEMTRCALSFLEKDKDGFFLMVEGARIDHAGHSNDIERMVPEVVEFARAVEVAVAWASERDDTLIIVTADHETGGLSVRKGRGVGQAPRVRWSTTGHTGVRVPLYAWGPGAERLTGVVDNTDIYRVMMAFYARPPKAASETAGAAAAEPGG